MRLATFIDLVAGTDARLRRMLRYWAATAVLYTIYLILLYTLARLGMVPHADMVGMTCYAAGGTAAFYVLVRAGGPLGLTPTRLSALQGLFAISCNMWAYAISGPLHGSTLMVQMVVLVFCTFALRPRHTMQLAFCGLVGMGATMWWKEAHDPQHYPLPVETVSFLVLASCSLAVTFLTGEMTKLRARLKRKKENLEAALVTIRTLATTDDLTALANRRHMNAVLAEAEQTGADGTVCIALLDIDFFKRINDRHGHAGGDAVLRRVAAMLRAGLRKGDVLARWGGEEFLVLLPDTDPDTALALIERVRVAVAAATFTEVEDGGGPLHIGFSGGVSQRHGAEPFSATINRADKALYRAKSSGRGRILAG
jgi:diguanylate cyclase (GGDEF)-like protein